MKALLNRAYNELELSRQQTEKLLAHKNHTIEQLSKQVDTVRHDHDKENKLLKLKCEEQRNKISKLQKQNDSNQITLKRKKSRLKNIRKLFQNKRVNLKMNKIRTINIYNKLILYIKR